MYHCSALKALLDEFKTQKNYIMTKRLLQLPCRQSAKSHVETQISLGTLCQVFVDET